MMFSIENCDGCACVAKVTTYITLKCDVAPGVITIFGTVASVLYHVRVLSQQCLTSNVMNFANFNYWPLTTDHVIMTHTTHNSTLLST